MNKNSVRGHVALGILFTVFSVIAFVVPFQKATLIFWLAYVFGVVAIAFQLYVFKIAFSGKDVKSKFYGFPIARVGIIYLAVQIVLSFIEMVLATLMPVWMSIILNVIIAALAVLGCIATEAMKDEIERQDVQLKKEVSNMRALQSQSSALVNQSNNRVKAAVQDLANEFKYSDPVTCDQSVQIENELANMMSELQNAVIDNDNASVIDLCKKIAGILAERNRICKLNK